MYITTTSHFQETFFKIELISAQEHAPQQRATNYMDITSLKPLNLLELQSQFYQKLKNHGKSLNTLKNYKTDLDCFNKYLVGAKNHLNFADFKLEEVLEYGKFLESKYSSNNSIRRRVQALRIFFDFLVETGVIPSNPVRKLPTSPKFLDVPRPNSLSEIKTLWSYLKENSSDKPNISNLINTRNQLIVLLVFGAGLKVSDIKSLKEKHIMIGDGEARVLISHPKKDPYTIPLPEVFVPIFTRYQKQLHEEKKVIDIEFDELFFNANPHRILSGGLSPRGLELIFKEFGKTLLFEITPKSLRQAAIYNWLYKNESDASIKEWLGVAPSYSLKLYKDHKDQHIISDNFLNNF